MRKICAWLLAAVLCLGVLVPAALKPAVESATLESAGTVLAQITICGPNEPIEPPDGPLPPRGN